MTSYLNTVLGDGPSAYWPMHESGDTIVDIVGGVGAVWSSPIGAEAGPLPYGKARDFPGNSEQHFKVPLSDVQHIGWLGGDWSAEWWMLNDSVGQDAYFSFRTSSASSDMGASVFTGTSGAGIVAVDMGSGGTRTAFSGYSLPTGSWHHYVYSYTQVDSIRRLYVDGVQVSTSSSTSVAPSYVGPLHIGILGGNATYAFDGRMSDLAFYHKALTPERVAAHYAARSEPLDGYPKVLINGNWEKHPAKYWNGSKWLYRPMKRWDGSTWKLI